MPLGSWLAIIVAAAQVGSGLQDPFAEVEAALAKKQFVTARYSLLRVIRDRTDHESLARAYSLLAEVALSAGEDPKVALAYASRGLAEAKPTLLEERIGRASLTLGKAQLASRKAREGLSSLQRAADLLCERWPMQAMAALRLHYEELEAEQKFELALKSADRLIAIGSASDNRNQQNYLLARGARVRIFVRLGRLEDALVAADYRVDKDVLAAVDAELVRMAPRPSDPQRFQKLAIARMAVAVPDPVPGPWLEVATQLHLSKLDGWLRWESKKKDKAAPVALIDDILRLLGTDEAGEPPALLRARSSIELRAVRLAAQAKDFAKVGDVMMSYSKSSRTDSNGWRGSDEADAAGDALLLNFAPLIEQKARWEALTSRVDFDNLASYPFELIVRHIVGAPSLDEEVRATMVAVVAPHVTADILKSNLWTLPASVLESLLENLGSNSDAEGVATAMLQLAYAYFGVGRLGDCLRWSHLCSVLAHEQGFTSTEGNALFLETYMSISRGQWDQATQLIDRMDELVRQNPEDEDLRSAVDGRDTLRALITLSKGDVSGALRALEDQYARSWPSESPVGRSVSLSLIAWVQLLGGNQHEAERSAKRAIALDDSSIGTAHLVLARIFASQSKWQEARDQLEAALTDETFKFGLPGAHPFDFKRELAYVLQKQGENDRAAALLIESYEDEIKLLGSSAERAISAPNVTALVPDPGIARAGPAGRTTSLPQPLIAGLGKATCYALIVGGKNYDHFPGLANTLLDTQAIKKELEDIYGYKVIYLEDPTRKEFEVALEKITAIDFGPADQLLVYFAGHGGRSKQNGAYMIFKDTPSGGGVPGETPFIYPLLEMRLATSKAPQILLMLDCCYSGGFLDWFAQQKLELMRGTPTGGATAETIAREFQWPSRLVMTSAQSFELASDGKPGQHSPFAYDFLDCLRQPGPDGVVSFRTLLAASQWSRTRCIGAKFDHSYTESGANYLFITKQARLKFFGRPQS